MASASVAWYPVPREDDDGSAHGTPVSPGPAGPGARGLAGWRARQGRDDPSRLAQRRPGHRGVVRHAARPRAAGGDDLRVADQRRARRPLVHRSPHAAGPGAALHEGRDTDAGHCVRGSRVLATLGPLADEIAVYSPRLAQLTEPHSPFAVNFAIPCGTPGLRFLCRESFDLGRSHFDHPLGSRFEEMDCIVFFDDVLVPWERVFLLGDVDLLNRTATATHSTAHSAHQGAVKNLAKAEFVLGVALLMTQALGNAHLPNVEERIGELMLYTQLTRACMRAAEADAQLDEWGVMCPDLLMVESPRNLFMTAYPRMVEILQLLGSSSFMLTPTDADMKGPLGPAIGQYLATDNSPA